MKDVTDSLKRSKKPQEKKKGKFNFRWLYLVLLVVVAIYYYITLPPIHYASGQFWFFLALISIGIIAIELLSDGLEMFTDRSQFSIKKIGWKYKYMAIFWLAVMVVGFVSRLIFSPFFFSKSYSEMITVEVADFTSDFPETDVNQIPLIDRDTAMRLGNRRLGALTDLVSQFEVADDYTQININDYPCRVSPLEYAGFFRWLNNFRDGIPHYVKVDNVTGDVTLETPDQPIKYSHSDLFNRDVMRKLRFSNPFSLFNQPSFEVDDEGTPYYIASTYSRNFFLYEPEANGVITLNALTGESTRYGLDEIPTWIDRVHPSELILHQLEMNGMYSNGFWNSMFSQEGVTQPTAGYNYLPINDDLYLYTGITSVAADESNIGFVLVNLRTKEATMYPLDAAEEFSAMRSAEGSVQETGYTATFPLLINLEGRPMYILSLKDSSGLIKEYALIDVQNYQRVYVEPTVERLLLSYAEENPLKVDEIETEEDLQELSGQVEDIEAVVVEGNTVYYFLLDGQVYRANISINEALPFLDEGTEVEIMTTEDGVIRQIDWQ